MLELLGNHTVQTVTLGAVLLGMVSGLLGSFAVLRQQSLLGDTLAHAALPGVCIGFLIAGTRHLGWIMAGALVTAVIAALFVQVVTRYSRIKMDAGLGAALSVSFAVGVVLLTYIQGHASASQGGLDSFLFGQAAATRPSDLWFMGGVTLAAMALVALMWKQLKLVTFDPLFAGSIGLRVGVLETLLTAMIALAVVVGLQMVGVVLMTAMVIAPPVAARQWVSRLEHMVFLAMLMGVISGVVGVLLSAGVAHLATGPVVVLVASALVALSLLLAPGRGVLWSWLKLWREQRSIGQRQMLVTLHKLAEHHEDPYYPVERSMLDSFYGVATSHILRRLQARGFVVPASHMRQEGPHWALTDAGHNEARQELERMDWNQAEV